MNNYKPYDVHIKLVLVTSFSDTLLLYLDPGKSLLRTPFTDTEYTTLKYSRLRYSRRSLDILGYFPQIQRTPCSVTKVLALVTEDNQISIKHSLDPGESVFKTPSTDTEDTIFEYAGLSLVKHSRNTSQLLWTLFSVTSDILLRYRGDLPQLLKGSRSSQKLRKLSADPIESLPKTSYIDTEVTILKYSVLGSLL